MYTHHTALWSTSFDGRDNSTYVSLLLLVLWRRFNSKETATNENWFQRNRFLRIILIFATGIVFIDVLSKNCAFSDRVKLKDYYCFPAYQFSLDEKRPMLFSE